MREKNNYSNITFIKSSANYQQCPAENIPEFALIGRSNVGKSSLINLLANNSKLAQTSSKPGKTKLINHFSVNEQWYLVDLPGYGWAKASKSEKKKWESMINDYILKRENLYGVFVLIDSRLPPQPVDIAFINWLGKMQVPLMLIFTKIDKLSNNKVSQNINKVKNKILETWETIPPYFLTSAEKKVGKEDIINFIEQNI